MRILNHRRAISTVIGGMLFVILLSAGLAVMSIALSSQISTVETHSQVSEKKIKKLQEDFTVKATLVGTTMNVNVINEGPNPVVTKTIWIIGDGTGVDYANRIELDTPYVVFNDDEFHNIKSVSNLDTSTWNHVYVKVISELGNVEINDFDLPVDSTSESNDQVIANISAIPFIGQNTDHTISLSLTNLSDKQYTTNVVLTTTDHSLKIPDTDGSPKVASFESGNTKVYLVTNSNYNLVLGPKVTKTIQYYYSSTTTGSTGFSASITFSDGTGLPQSFTVGTSICSVVNKSTQAMINCIQ